MPLLPKRNNLDYNPNSIINASKTLKTIALENMKNPLIDPDMKTLSTMDAEKNLDVNLASLGQMYEELQSTFRKLEFAFGITIQIPAELQGYGRMRGGAEGEEKKKAPVELIIEEGEEEIIPRPRGRPRGSKNKPRPSLAMVAPEGSIKSSGSYPSISSRYSSNLVSSSGNSQAVPFSDPEDPDDESSYYPSSVSSRSRTRTTRSGRSIPLPEEESVKEVSIKPSISNVILTAISQIQKMNFFLVSRIKPVFRKLDAKQQGFLGDLQNKFSNLYSEIFRTPVKSKSMSLYGNLENIVIGKIDNGDELLQYLKRTIDEFLLNLTIVFNASRQESGIDTPLSPADYYVLSLAGFTGDPREGKIPEGSGRKPRMTGCGRNFYGDVINQTRDIPSIRRSYQNCPTKYLL